jgi:hypothetical protein
MDIVMSNRFFPSLKTRAQLEERRIDMSRSDKNSEIYVIPMHRKNVWNKKWPRDPRNNFCRLVTMIPVRSIGKVGGHLKKRED